MPTIEYTTPITLLFVTAFAGAVFNALFSHRCLLRARTLAEAGKGGSPLYTLLTLAGHPTSVFTLWLLPVFLVLIYSYGAGHIEEIFTTADLKEPFANFTFIFLALSPTLHEAFNTLTTAISNRLGGSARTWWVSAHFLAVILSGLISEVGMMIVVCYVLAKKMLPLQPSRRFFYATLAVLLISMSLGNLVIPFNVTASMDQSTNWGWSHWTILKLLSWRALLTISILIIGALRYLKDDFDALDKQWKKEKAPEPTPISAKVFGYVFLILLAGYFEDVSYFLISIVALVCVVERSQDHTLHSDRLRIPLLIALFSYSLELHAFFLSQSIEMLYAAASPGQYTALSTALTALNEHLPGVAFINTHQELPTTLQAMGILSIAVGGGITIFANSANVEAHMILRKTFPDKVISGLHLCLYTIPIAAAAVLLLHATFMIV